MRQKGRVLRLSSGLHFSRESTLAGNNFPLASAVLSRSFGPIIFRKCFARAVDQLLPLHATLSELLHPLIDHPLRRRFPFGELLSRQHIDGVAASGRQLARTRG